MFQSYGPIIHDETHPVFEGEITVDYTNNFLVASWISATVTDSEHGLYPLEYTFAIGNHVGMIYNPTVIEISRIMLLQVQYSECMYSF